MKNRRVIFSLAAVLLLVLGGAGVWYATKAPVDHRLYATNESRTEQIPLTFLYAVDPDTNKVLVYSPVLQGSLGGNGNLKQSDCFIAADKTATGNPTACNRVEAGAGDNEGENKPVLIWTDMQDMYQQQFFTQGQIVFIVEQPLVVDRDNYLIHVPGVAAASAN